MNPRKMGRILADHSQNLIQAISHPDPATAKRAFQAMMTMKKINVAEIEKALEPV